MFDYQSHFNTYCNTEGLDIHLSFCMPSGYENANGTFDVATRTVFINKAILSNSPDYEKLFFLLHELRHAAQYLAPNKFDAAISKSLQYVIMFDGTCYKLIDGVYHVCKLDGGEDYFVNLYLGQPYEVDANTFAYECTKNIYGNSEPLKKLYEFWIPQQPIPNEIYDTVYALIDEKIKAGK